MAAGIATASLQIGRSRKPQISTLEPVPEPAPKPVSPEPQEILTESLESTPPRHLRYTKPHEEQYAHFIHSLDLTYIAPFELLRVHRN